MFNYFSKNKFRYTKGQMLSIFLVILAVLIIMSFATINIGKLSLTKTYTSNAADAGALAGGAIMAGIFNGQAQSNSWLFYYYEIFAADIAVIIIAGEIAAAMAPGACAAQPPGEDGECVPSPICLRLMQTAARLARSAQISIAAFHAAQALTYESMRENAEDNRESAIEAAYRYAFVNSGIGSKLISGKYENVSEPRGNAYNYSTNFSDWVKSDAVTSGLYAWTDGQGRSHRVEVGVEVQDLPYFIQYGIMPTALLLVDTQLAATAATTGAAGCAACPYCTIAAVEAGAEEYQIEMAIVVSGLIPQPEPVEENLLMEVIFPLYWIDDIGDEDDELYRKVRVVTWQEHGGSEDRYDVMWTAQYPRIGSRSLVDFSGDGQIAPESVAGFDADIWAIDKAALGKHKSR